MNRGKQCNTYAPRTLPLLPLDAVSPRLVEHTIQLQKHYLLHALRRPAYGFTKFYNVLCNTSSARLRTVYSASALFTLLNVHKHWPDPAIARVLAPVADFLLRMQVDATTAGPEVPAFLHGAFHYSVHQFTGAKEDRFVVGTASKVIYTLVELIRWPATEPERRQRYLHAAQQAADWLLTRVDQQGRVSPEVRRKSDKRAQNPRISEPDAWVQSQQVSFLYSGQTLSALARMFRLTQEPRYEAGARRVAQWILQGCTAQDFFVGDDFRPKSCVPTSWAIMSLLDWWLAVRRDDPELSRIESTIHQCLRAVLEQQAGDPRDLLHHGWFHTTVSSGTGWINEVLVTLQANGWRGLNRPILLASRWLIQNTYDEASAQRIARNPMRALGGIMRTWGVHVVRTDGVCHAANSLIGFATQENVAGSTIDETAEFLFKE